MTLADSLAAHPARETFDLPELLRAIQACQNAATLANLCADSDLSRGDGMHDCIRSCQDTATIATATASILSRPNPSGDAWEAQVQACIRACMESAKRCEGHEHVCCTSCAAACREAEQALQQLLAAAAS